MMADAAVGVTDPAICGADEEEAAAASTVV